MGDRTKISWTDTTWNPVRGCSRVSEGCRHCYAERVAVRFSGKGRAYEGLVRIGKQSRGIGARGPMRRVPIGWNGVVRLVPERLADPLKWKRPRRIFVNSMSDLFHEALDTAVIDQVLAVMLLAPHHTFQVLTKRADRMHAYLSDPALYQRVLRAADEIRRDRPQLSQIAISNPATVPPPWIWWGVSVENQAAADERIPELLATPAAVRFLSCEPLLGPLALDGSTGGHDFLGDHTDRDEDGLDWIISGCESGPDARWCDNDWLRSLRDQCASAGVAFFLKQASAHNHHSITPNGELGVRCGDGSKRKAGGVIELPYLDGVMHAAFPELR
jgi:protein gp37